MPKSKKNKKLNTPEVSIRNVEKILSNRWWRLNNLYWIIDKGAKKIKFKPNEVQTRLYNERWYRNVILKSRQHGITTFVCLLFLDAVLFSKNVTAEIIAHTIPDAGKIFEKKIKFAYESLPREIQLAMPIKTDRARELTFANNSTISVSTSARSRSPNYLLISELGLISQKFPEKAREIISGSIPAVHAGNIIFIESTADGGPMGHFYTICKTSEDKKKLGKKLTMLDFKFHFFSWHEDDKNKLNPENVVITDSFESYFESLEKDHGIILNDEQKAWYVVTESYENQMHIQHPSYSEEAFRARTEGAYYREQFNKVREEKRICPVPYHDGIAVNTAWDIGMSHDSMAIWFWQLVGRELHVIDFYQSGGYGFGHYADMMNEKGYRYGRHIGPHDLMVRNVGRDAITRLQSAKDVGVEFTVIPRLPLDDGINNVREIMSICYFDEKKCADGIKALENYKREWDDKREQFKNTPFKNIHSHAADAFRILATYYKISTNRTDKKEIRIQNISNYMYT